MESNNLNNLAWMYHHDWTPALLKSDGNLTIFGNFVKGYLTTVRNLNKPDLIITAVTLTPAFPQPNETFDVSITIKNQGGAGGASVVYRDVYIDRDPSADLNSATGCTSAGQFFRSDSYISLEPGMSDTKVVTITGGLPVGGHQIWAYVDARCLIDEN
jgi:hypothetical protein